jgi:hypothetical protein
MPDPQIIINPGQSSMEILGQISAEIYMLIYACDFWTLRLPQTVIDVGLPSSYPKLRYKIAYSPFLFFWALFTPKRIAQMVLIELRNRGTASDHSHPTLQVG